MTTTDKTTYYTFGDGSPGLGGSTIRKY